ncbi:endonuclease/exonuclease/phosphatase family protein [Psychromonas aquatilis]|uniref:Endonuclease/exonuclease/phosphatase family protein n=1 Tax=Psychromonas aquatilis TaxID=2005072 RepID=A0ABU9GU56_9GAMM
MIRISRLNNKLKLLYLFILLLAISSYYLLPRVPKELTVIDKMGKHSTALCPQLTPAMPAQAAGFVDDTFSLLNWNIYKQQNPQWQTQLEKWSSETDFITLQEAKYDQRLIDFSDQEHLYPLQNVAFSMQGTDYGVNTFSRIQPLQKCATRYSEPWTYIPKTGLASTYAIRGSQQTLLLINLHGVNFTLTSTPLKEQVSPYLQLIEAHQGPIIISGDFNTWSKARSEEVIDTLISEGFAETLFSKDQRLIVFGYPLDHVFYRDLTVLGAQSIETDASDHTPQRVTFSL